MMLDTSQRCRPILPALHLLRTTHPAERRELATPLLNASHPNLESAALQVFATLFYRIFIPHIRVMQRLIKRQK
jgi:hypothetical protein